MASHSPRNGHELATGWLRIAHSWPVIAHTSAINGVHLAQPEKQHVLFICSRNQWRSPTAEQLWRRHPLLSVRSAGTSPNARRRVSHDDIAWSTVIMVMEEKHKSRLKAEFSHALAGRAIHVLDIPDDYRYMDPELVEQLEQSVASLLDLP